MYESIECGIFDEQTLSRSCMPRDSYHVAVSKTPRDLLKGGGGGGST